MILATDNFTVLKQGWHVDVPPDQSQSLLIAFDDTNTGLYVLLGNTDAICFSLFMKFTWKVGLSEDIDKNRL